MPLMARIELCNDFYDFLLQFQFLRFFVGVAIFHFTPAKITNFTFFAIFLAVERFFAVFCLTNFFTTTEASRPADVTKFTKYRCLNDFSRCLTIFRSLLAC